MTVKELKEKLAEYPDKMRVKLAVGVHLKKCIECKDVYWSKEVE